MAIPSCPAKRVISSLRKLNLSPVLPVFFKDPVPCPNPAERAVKMAVAMRETAGALTIAWRRRGRVLGFGAGIAQGYATLGQIGFADRSGYTAIGTVCNLAARLCAEAKDGQILVAQRVAVAVEEMMPLEEVGELTLRGLTQPVVAFNVPLAAIQPALRVIRQKRRFKRTTDSHHAWPVAPNLLDQDFTTTH
jgi:class 3 adenylate cyclase